MGMIDAALLAVALATTLRGIPELVADMDGDSDRIRLYHDESVSRDQAIYEMESPGVLVIWEGGSESPEGPGGFDRYNQEFSIILRVQRSSPDDPAGGYFTVLRHVVEGIPTGWSNNLLNQSVHPDFYPMKLGTWARKQDAEGVDYFELPVNFVQIGG